VVSDSELTYYRVEPAGSFEVVIGFPPKQGRTTVHKDIAVSRSRFFEAAFSDRRTTSTGPLRPIELVDEDPKVFCSWLQVAYTDETFTTELPNTWHFPIIPDDFTRLLRMYILADRLQDLHSANIIMDDLVTASMHTKEGAADIRAAMISAIDANLQPVYTCVLAGSKLQCLLSDCFILEMSRWRSTYAADAIASELLLDVQQAIEEGAGMLNLKRFAHESLPYHRRDKCFYRQHDAANPKCENERGTVSEETRISRILRRWAFSGTG
jgi:hypothetical protein